MLLRQIDSTLDQLRKIQFKKIGSAQAGNLIGDIEGHDSISSKRQFTAMCKTDCILLELEQDVFDVLNKQRKRKDREFKTNHIIRTFPRILKSYTTYNISQNAPDLMKRATFRRGQIIVKEANKTNLQIVDAIVKENEKKLHLIVEGAVMVSKRIAYHDENGLLRSRMEDIMELHEGDVVGEDKVWYDRSSYYTARVSSKEAMFFQIDNMDFEFFFSKMVALQKPIFDARLEFIEQRCKILRFQNEYKCLGLNKRLTAHDQNQWFLQKQ